MNQQAQEFLEAHKDSEFGVYSKAFQTLPKEAQKVVQQAKYREHRKEMDKGFTPENRGKVWEPVLSPSGRFKLVVTSYDLAKDQGGWSYTQGLVYEGDTLLFEVRRNYFDFNYTWVEDHPNGHSYLVCGEDYQGQTVLELDTGRRRDSIPTEEFLGWGFCWVGCRFEHLSQMLIVDGCYWACPYEYRFYDFSNPMEGWPELKLPDFVYDDSKSPTVESDGTIKCYQSSDENEEGVDTVVATQTFRREGLELILVEEWVDEEEKKRRAEQEESRRKHEEWLANYKATDPFYLAVKELAEGDPDLNPEDYIGIGQTYEGWCPDFDGHDTRISRGIHRNGEFRAGLEWGVKTAPVKLELHNGEKRSTQFFEHSVEGIREAFAKVKEALDG